MADTLLEELDHRVRELANEVKGEKMITRHLLDQYRRNGAEIAAVRVELNTLGLRIDNLTGDVTAPRAALNRLNIIGQDVAMLRGEVIEIRRDIVTLREQVDTVGEHVDAMREQVDTLRGQMDAMQKQVNTVREQMGTLREQMDTMRGHVDIVREEAAVRHHELLAAIRALAGASAPPA